MQEAMKTATDKRCGLHDLNRLTICLIIEPNMNRRTNLFFVAAMISLIAFALIVAGMIATSILGNPKSLTASSMAPNSASTPVDFFSQEFSSSTDIVPLSGLAVGGLGDSLLKSSVWNSLLDYERKQDCNDVTSKSIIVAQINEAGEFWVENWTVSACGKTEVFKVRFTPDQIGGTKYFIAP